MALSGYSDKVCQSASGSASHSSLWRETCVELELNFKHIYLQAAFSFLSANPPLSSPSSSPSSDFKYILYESELELKDKISFACCFLSDVKVCSLIVLLAS